MNIFHSVAELAGNTPLLELCRYEHKHGLNARILAKLECCNVAGSAKDRVAKHMIERAEAEGKLVPGSVIIEPTSGNTGIGLAAMAKVLADAAVHAAVEVATVELTRDRDEYRALAQGAESQVNRLEARVFELEAELAEAQGVPAKAEAEKPAESDAAPQAAPKKGSGAKKG